MIYIYTLLKWLRVFKLELSAHETELRRSSFGPKRQPQFRFCRLDFTSEVLIIFSSRWFVTEDFTNIMWKCFRVKQRFRFRFVPSLGAFQSLALVLSLNNPLLQWIDWKWSKVTIRQTISTGTTVLTIKCSSETTETRWKFIEGSFTMLKLITRLKNIDTWISIWSIKLQTITGLYRAKVPTYCYIRLLSNLNKILC